MTGKVVLKVILTYFAVALIIFLSAYFFQAENAIPTLLSILLLIPIFLWQSNAREKEKLSSTIDGRDKGIVLFWIFALFILALSVRIPFALSFGVPYEKTPLIYLVILTMIAIEEIDISAFGFKTRNIGKAILYGLIFYAVFGGMASLIRYLLVHVFANQPLALSYDIIPFLFALPFHTLCVGISEEGLFRGYMQTHLEKFYSSTEAVLVQAVFFGIWHFVWDLYPFDPWGMTQYVATTFFIGLLFGYFYSKVRNLASTVIAHGLWNSVQLGMLVNRAALDALQTIPIAVQILIWLLPYAISAVAAVIFTKLFVKEI